MSQAVAGGVGRPAKVADDPPVAGRQELPGSRVIAGRALGHLRRSRDEQPCSVFSKQRRPTQRTETESAHTGAEPRNIRLLRLSKAAADRNGVARLRSATMRRQALRVAAPNQCLALSRSSCALGDAAVRDTLQARCASGKMPIGVAPQVGVVEAPSTAEFNG